MKTTPIIVIAGILTAFALAGCTASSSRPSPSSTSPMTASASVTITGGFETKGVDKGRPVVLVAAALGVPEEVFRTAFHGVTPAAGGTEPESAQVLLNKQALLKVLSPYGITNDQLDVASNYYRYSGSAGQTWPHTAATLSFSNGTVTMVSGGSGYTSAPTITLADGRTATATIAYGKDLKTNGSITSVTFNQP